MIIFLKDNYSSAIDSQKIFNVKIDVFYPLISLLFLGNFLFLINFFIPLNNSWLLLAFLALSLILTNFKEKFQIYDYKLWFIKHVFTPVSISIS